MISGLHQRISNSDGTTTATIDIQRIKSSVHIIMNLIIVFFVLLQRQKHFEFPMEGEFGWSTNSDDSSKLLDFTRSTTVISPESGFHQQPEAFDQPKASNDQHVFVWEHLVVPNILSSWSSNTYSDILAADHCISNTYVYCISNIHISTHWSFSTIQWLIHSHSTTHSSHSVAELQLQLVLLLLLLKALPSTHASFPAEAIAQRKQSSWCGEDLRSITSCLHDILQHTYIHIYNII